MDSDESNDEKTNEEYSSGDSAWKKQKLPFRRKDPIRASSDKEYQPQESNESFWRNVTTEDDPSSSRDNSEQASSSKKKVTKAKTKFVRKNTDLCRDGGNEWLSEVGSFKNKNIDKLSTRKDYSGQSTHDNDDQPSTSYVANTASSADTIEEHTMLQSRQFVVDSSDDERDQNEAPHSKKRKTSNLPSRFSDTASENSDYRFEEKHVEFPEKMSSPFTEEEERWLNKDIKPLAKAGWSAIPELKKRQIGLSSNAWTNKVCASRAMVRRFRINWELKKHQGCVNALHFNQSGGLLASGSDDLKIMVWDWVDKTREPLVQYDSGHRNNVFQAKFMPNCEDSMMITTARDGQVRMADLAPTGECLGTKKIAQHHGSAHKIALQYTSNSVFLSCGEDASVFLMDLRMERASRKLVSVRSGSNRIPLYSIQNHPKKPHEFAVSGRHPNAFLFDQRMIRSTDAGYDTRTSPLKLYCPHHLHDSKANITCLAYNWNGSELLCSYNDEDIYLFNTENSSGDDYIKRYKGHRNRATVKGVNFYGPSSEYIISGSDCGNMFLWEKESARVVNFSEGDNGGVVNVLEPHPEYAAIATSGLDSEIKVWLPILDPNEQMCDVKLKKLMIANKQERDDDNQNMPDSFQNHLLWFLMQSLRNRTIIEEEEENSSSTDSTYTSSDSTDSFGPEGPEYENMRCVQS